MESISTKDRGAPSELERHVEGFARQIDTAGYCGPVVLRHSRLASAVAEAMETRGMSPRQLDEEAALPLFSEIAAGLAHSSQRYARRCMHKFRDYLIEHAGAPPDAVVTDMSPLACQRREYRRYLKQVRGLADSTIYVCLRVYDRFLAFRFGEEFGDARDIVPDDITAFMATVRAAGSRNRDVPSHLRNLFRFLLWSGRTERDLSKAVPSVKGVPRKIPRHLTPAEVNRVVAAVGQRGKAAKRNYAIVLTMARLGLREPEVVGIELDDIDWRAGEILVRGKGRLHDRMPLPADVGEAIVDYIRHERRGRDRALFVSTNAPFGRLKRVRVRLMLAEAYKATGVTPPRLHVGAHVLRHSLATDMLRKGASLEEIGDVLRHRSAKTTTIYAQHDVDALRSISRPWPTEGDRE